MEENKYPVMQFECNTAYDNVVVMKRFENGLVFVKKFEDDGSFKDWLCPISTVKVDDRLYEEIAIGRGHYCAGYDCLDECPKDVLVALDRSCRHAFALSQALRDGTFSIVEIPDRSGPMPRNVDAYECGKAKERPCEEVSEGTEHNYKIVGFGTIFALDRCATESGAIAVADWHASRGLKVEVRFQGKAIYVATPKIADEILVNRVCEGLETAFKDVAEFQKVVYATNERTAIDLHAFIQAVASTPMDSIEYPQDCIPHQRIRLYNECKTLINLALAGYVGRVECDDGVFSTQMAE